MTSEFESEVEITEDLNKTDPSPSDYQESKSTGEYYPPRGFKLVPEEYIAVEPAVYQVMVSALKNLGSQKSQQPIHVQVDAPQKEEPKPVFHVRLLQQFMLGDVGYNLVKGQEIEYCPEGKYVQIDGERHDKLRSFLQIWRMQFGARPDPKVVRQPIFQILNSDTCPPIHMSLGKTPPRGAYPSDAQRVQAEERRGDAARRRVRMSGETQEYNLGVTQAPQASSHDLNYDPAVREQVYRGAGRNPQFIQPQYPQQAMQYEIDRRSPTMPPRAGIIGEDGLTARGRAIKNMSADQIERPVQRQVNQPIAGYEPPESVEDFYVEQGTLAGGQIVGQIPGEPADEALDIARRLDAQAAYEQAQRTRY